VAIYSRHGLNNTANTHGCCCGGNELTNSLEVNVNTLMVLLLEHLTSRRWGARLRRAATGVPAAWRGRLRPTQYR